MNSWLWFDSGKGDGAFNMALDEALLEAMTRLQRPGLRFYGWQERAATFGYFQRYVEVKRLTPLRPLLRRPTGGGLVPHDVDWTYSAAFPPGHEWHSLKAEESYRRIHDWLRQAFAALNVGTELAPAAKKSLPGQCFAGHEKFDLLWHGRKIAGAAQRRNKSGLLIQGSVQPPPVPLKRADWQSAMTRVAARDFPVSWTEWSPDEPLRAEAERLTREKCSRADYNRKR